MSANCHEDKLESGSALHCAGSDNGPKSFAGFPSFETARPLRDESVYHHKAHRLLSQIVGRTDSPRRDELKVGLAVGAKSLGHVERFPFLLFAVFVQKGWNVVNRDFHDLFAGTFQRTHKGLRGEFLTIMDHSEHLLHGDEQPVAVGFCFGIGQAGQELDVAD